MINPWMIIGGICIVLATYKYGSHAGYKERDAEMQSEIARLNDESRAKEQKLAQDLNNTSSQLLEANNAISQKQSALDRAISAGRVRFPSSSCVQAATSAAVASRDSQEAGGKSNGQANSSLDEQERQTLAAIAEIIAQGDRNTAQLNACIDAYNAVREQINSQVR
jgi:septation ring formation regulator EzrA